jgi:hypothetical protein
MRFHVITELLSLGPHVIESLGYVAPLSGSVLCHTQDMQEGCRKTQYNESPKRDKISPYVIVTEEP